LGVGAADLDLPVAQGENNFRELFRKLIFSGLFSGAREDSAVFTHGGYLNRLWAYIEGGKGYGS
jgi:hypothetical protein